MRHPSKLPGTSTDVTQAEPAEEQRTADEPFLLRIRGIKKRYGNTQALDDVDLVIRPAEAVGVVGHNGAGKSTLMRVIAGFTAPDSGVVEVSGWTGDGRYDPVKARDLGVRIAFQELSLCPTLRVYENVIVAHPALTGLGWRRRAQAAIRRQLDAVFPGHRISPRALIGSLPLARRQMVEVAQASLHTDQEPKLLILDEPTSALGKESADNLFQYLRRAVEDGLSFVLISHRIAEVLENVDRVIVMRNGRVVAEQAAAALTEEEIISLMGAATVPTAHAEREALASGAEPVVEVNGLTNDRLRGISVQARPGEIIGLAGLDGQGQRELLLELWRSRRRLGHRAVKTRGRVAFVTGDRQAAGVFPLWPVIRNLSIASLFRLGGYGFVDPRKERDVTRHWIQRLAIKGSPDTPVPDLSGGTQQKVLVARAMAVGADVVLLDDPFRGVDVGTKREIYRLLRDESLGGRCFVWFTTENAELRECDRVYVFHEGRIVAELSGEEITEERVIAASFSGAGG